MRMSCCFFSSRLKMRISATSLRSMRRTTALPNVPVPPVIRRVQPSNTVLITFGLPWSAAIRASPLRRWALWRLVYCVPRYPTSPKIGFPDHSWQFVDRWLVLLSVVTTRDLLLASG